MSLSNRWAVSSPRLAANKGWIKLAKQERASRGILPVSGIHTFGDGFDVSEATAADRNPQDCSGLNGPDDITALE